MKAPVIADSDTTPAFIHPSSRLNGPVKLRRNELFLHGYVFSQPTPLNYVQRHGAKAGVGKLDQMCDVIRLTKTETSVKASAGFSSHLFMADTGKDFKMSA